MEIRCFHINAFCNQLFQGNPAMVCLLPHWLEDQALQSIATENALPVTVFLVKTAVGFNIRWFTPETELELCGHGTLAAAFVLLKLLEPTRQTMTLHSDKAGSLVIRQGNDLLEFYFPAKSVTAIACEPLLTRALNLTPEAVYSGEGERLMVLLTGEKDVKAAEPNIALLKQLGYRGIILCALSDRVDFVSRTFYPSKAIPEDAVTGASHCYLAPYFAKRLAKNSLLAQQLSARGGKLWLDVKAHSVTIKAQAILYAQGIITIKQESLRPLGRSKLEWGEVCTTPHHAKPRPLGRGAVVLPP